MKRLILFSLLLYKCTFCTLTAASIEDDILLRVVTEDVYPMTYIDKDDNNVKGYAYEYLKDILNNN